MKRQFTKGNIKMTNMHKKILYISSYQRYMQKETTIKYYDSFYLLNFIIGTVFFLGYYSVIDNLIAILFSSELSVDRSISFVITLNGFVQFMRRSTLTFRDATGSFYGDRWKPLIEGLVNIVLSIILVNYIGVVGVIVATIITNLLICHIVEPYVLYKNAFCISPVKFYKKNYTMMSMFFIMLVIESTLMQSLSNEYAEMALNGAMSIIVSIILCVTVFLFNKKQFFEIVKMIKKG